MNPRIRKPAIYEIQIEEQVKEQWAGWLFAGAIQKAKPCPAGGHTAIIVSVPDQAALRGILNRIWDLNLTVIAVNLQVEQTATGEKDEDHLYPPAG